MNIRRRVRCVIPKGIGGNASVDYRDGKAHYECIADPSGDFTGGLFTLKDLQLSKEHFEIGTTFRNISTGKRIKIVRTSRPRPGKPKKVMQFMGKG